MAYVRMILVHISSLGFPFFNLKKTNKKKTCVDLKNPSKIFENKGNSIEINRYKLDT